MRVLRTEFYPDEIPSSGKRWDGGVGAFAVAWFSIPSNLPVELSPAFPEFKSWSFIDLDQPLKVARVEYTRHLVARFIDLSLRNRNTSGQNGLRKAVEDGRVISAELPPIHTEAVEAILQSGIVIERSPPESIPLKLLAEKGNYIALGAFVGYTAASGGTPWLMMISIPGGIIVMGAAVGVSRGLMNGLHRVIEKLISGTDNDGVVLEKTARARRKIRRNTTGD